MPAEAPAEHLRESEGGILENQPRVLVFWCLGTTAQLNTDEIVLKDTQDAARKKTCRRERENRERKSQSPSIPN